MLFKFAELWTDDIRARMAARSTYAKPRKAPVSRNSNVRLVPVSAQGDAQGRLDKNATFGQRRSTSSVSKGKGKMVDYGTVKFAPDGGIEMTYVPSADTAADDHEENRDGRAAGMKSKRKGVETFGAGLERGGAEPEVVLSESERKGRTQRRKGMRSGSKNTFRRM
jgi:ribosome biogenesis protein ENP2